LIGDVADVVTGFYSGNDSMHLRALPGEHHRSASKYAPVNEKLIATEPPSQFELYNGIKGSKHWVPIVKGGSISYVKPTTWFMDWSRTAVHSYRVTNRAKARFQNSSYYFRQGIAVPMVSSRRVTAALLDHRLFDQSIVGIFPKSQEHLLYLLAFFNSAVCTRLLREINPTTNNSANYIKRLPFLEPPSRILREVTRLVEEGIETLKAGGTFPTNRQAALNSVFDDIYANCLEGPLRSGSSIASSLPDVDAITTLSLR
jgi:hypothetical protein